MAKVNTHNNKVGHSELVGTLPVIATVRISLSTATDGTESILFQVTITDRHNVYGNVQMMSLCNQQWRPHFFTLRSLPL